MENFMKENFLMIWRLGKDMKNFQMDLNIKVNLKMVLNAERVYFSGLMEKFIKGNGKVEKNMEVEFGKAQTDKVI